MDEPGTAASAAERQRTLRTAIGCVGVGMHSGARVALTLHPAPADHGIRFRRGDRPGTASVPARYDAVVDTHHCTTLGLPGGPRVAAVEHVMAAFAACRIDNAVVEVSGPELPAMDGSAQPFAFLIECAGVVEQAEARPWIEVLKPVSARADQQWAAIEPHHETLIDCRIEHPQPAVGTQQRVHRFTSDSFRAEIAAARCFAFADSVEDLHARGLALGGSLKNAVIVDDDRILNEEGLRFRDEPVRHRILDVVGDLYLAGAPIRCRYVSRRSDHRLTNEVLRALFADTSAWRLVGGASLAASAEMPRAAIRA